MIQRRSIVVCILLSLVTCGIYGLYWLACLANDTNTASGRNNDTSGGMVVLLSIITCNIYHIYWMYKAGEKIDAARQMRGLPSQNNGLVYLLLTLFGFSIIAWALLQNELNNMSDARPAMKWRETALRSAGPSENGDGFWNPHKHRKRNSGRENLPEFFSLKKEPRKKHLPFAYSGFL